MKKSKLLQLYFCLGVASALACSSHAEEGDDTADTDAVFAKLSNALDTDNRDLFLSALRYPVKICIDGKYIRATNAQALAGYSLDQLLGGQALKQKLKASMGEMATGEVYEFSYGGDQACRS